MNPSTVLEQFGIEDGPTELIRQNVPVFGKRMSYRREPKSQGRSQLGEIIHLSLQSEMFVRMQKTLILIKILSESLNHNEAHIFSNESSDKDDKLPLNPKHAIAISQALQQVKASVRKISAIFSPIVFQLYPERVETITKYMANASMACARANEGLPADLLNDIQLPRVQAEISGEDMKIPQSPGQSAFKGYPGSQEHCLFLASIYLGETIEQMDRIFDDEAEIERLLKLIRPEIFAMEAASSKIHQILSNHKAEKRKWSWHSEFKTA
jgi:hypothetical protein